MSTRAHVARLAAALEEPTLAGAIRAYGRSPETFRTAVIRAGLREQVDKRYSKEYAIAREHRAQLNRTKLVKARETRGDAAAQRLLDLIEDAEFLADHHEHVEMAATRLGFRTVSALEQQLRVAGRHDILHRFNGPTPTVYDPRESGI